MASSVRVGGSWQDITGVNVRVASSWQEVKRGWVRVSGTWRLVWQNYTPSLSGENLGTVNDTNAGGPGLDARVGIYVNSDGTIDSYKYINDTGDSGGQLDISTDWVIPNSAASENDFWVRLTNNGGKSPLDSSAQFGTWYQLSSNRLFYVQRTTAGSYQFDVNVELAADSGGVNIIAGPTRYWGTAACLL